MNNEHPVNVPSLLIHIWSKFLLIMNLCQTNVVDTRNMSNEKKSHNFYLHGACSLIEKSDIIQRITQIFVKLQLSQLLEKWGIQASDSINNKNYYSNQRGSWIATLRKWQLSWFMKMNKNLLEELSGRPIHSVWKACTKTMHQEEVLERKMVQHVYVEVDWG